MMMWIIFMVLLGLLSFVLNRKHLLMVLLSLEFLVVIMFFFLFYYLSTYLLDTFFLIVFLVFSVCEGVLGLSILVSLVRMYGNDYFQSFNVLW
uniref:NADH-ubiquinone oxidoreductase chain 4L n=1 Tax=Leiochrinini sp. 2 ACP-2013 TaxID=1434620 RepID=A0A3G3FXH3_9CUCU|nr:NADH dehydrogenase subunit 4L [Leiochrinini sp. 2 ACP-2013]